jgi:hypothetical protein
MGWIKEVLGSFKYRNEVAQRNNGVLDDSRKIHWNIYVPENTTRSEFAKEFDKVHGSYKHKFLVPAMIIAERWFLPPYKHEGAVLDVPYNREWMIFERSWNKAMEDMITTYHYTHNQLKGVDAQKEVELMKSERNRMRYLKTLKQSAMYIPMMDTYYHEFGVFLMHNIYREMAKEFDGKVYNRVLYDSSSVRDTKWYIAQQMVSGDGKNTRLNMVCLQDGGIKWVDDKEKKRLIKETKVKSRKVQMPIGRG